MIGIIQARMGSTRLPGKVMTNILGKPMLWHIHNRLSKCELLDEVVISTTDNKSDKPIHNFAESYNISYYAGSEDDILDRLYHTGKKFGSKDFVKINGDCPLVDISVVSDAISKYLSTSPSPDLIVNSLTSTYPEGLQIGVFNFNTLSKLWRKIKDPFWREFIYMYLVEHKNQYSVINIENDKDLSDMRWVVDYPEDLEFVRQIYLNLYEKNNLFGISEILYLLQKNPDIVKINSKYATTIRTQEYENLKNSYKSTTK